MAASDFDFLPSRNKLIRRAFSIVGAIEKGDSLSADMLDQGIEALNSMVARWQTDMLFLWRQKEYTIDPWEVSTASKTLPSDPLSIGISSAQWWDGVDWQPLEVISYESYLAITDRTTTGDPEKIASAPGQLTAYIYPTPSVERKARLVLITKGKDFDTATESGEFAARWNDALVYGLADSLSDEYPIPLSERERISRKAVTFFDAAKRYDRDRSDSEFVEPAY